MVVDKTGSLAGDRRHDYMPFGEEIPADSMWRTITRGYVGDNVRQEFTKYERDIETGLDFAKARYYAYAQGRFTSVDPIMMEKKRLADPQAINLYSYARNNPLKYIDPSGEKYKGTDGQEVIIKREKVNGKKIWVIKSGNASADLKRLVDLVNQSGSKSANKQFGRLNNHATMINVRIDTTTASAGSDRKTGLHEPHNQNGPVHFNSGANRFDDVADPAVDSKGKPIKGAYREATITLYQLRMEQDMKLSGDDLNAELVATFGHEAQHDLDPIQVQSGISGTGNDAIWHPRDKKGKPAKNSPYWFSDRIIKEIREARKKKP
jgi:RHS repeat-associated protein